MLGIVVCFFVFGVCFLFVVFLYFFFNDTATNEIYTIAYTLSLHDALRSANVDKHAQIDVNMQIDMKGNAPSNLSLATNENVDPKNTYTNTRETCIDMKNTYMDMKGTHIDTKNIYMSMRESIANSAPIDIEESAPLLLPASSMTSPATQAHNYVIRQALRPRPQVRNY